MSPVIDEIKRSQSFSVLHLIRRKSNYNLNFLKVDETIDENAVMIVSRRGREECVMRTCTGVAIVATQWDTCREVCKE